MVTNVAGIVLLAGIVPLVLGLLMGVYWESRKVYRGFGYWVLGDFAIGLGAMVISLRGRIPDLLSLAAGNALTVYSMILIYAGTERFLDRRHSNLLNYLLFGLYLMLEMFFTYSVPSPNARLAVSSLAIALFQLRIAYLLLRHSPEPLRRTAHVASLVFILPAIFCLLRAGYALSHLNESDIPIDGVLLAISLSSTCYIMVWTFYAVFLNSARVEMDLDAAGSKLALAADTSRREVAQLALLDEVSQLVSGSLDENEILKRTVAAMVSRFGYAEAVISMLVDEDKLELRAVSGTEDLGYGIGYRQSMGEGIIGHVGETRQIYLTGDVEHDPYYYSIEKRSGSAAGFPLLDESSLLGVMYVESTAMDAFKKSDIQTLRTLVNHVVTSVNKARLYASSQEHLTVMTTMHMISQIITSSLELDRIFQTVLQLLKDTYGYTHTGIYMLDGDVLHLAAEIGFSEANIIREIHVSEGVTGRTVRTRESQFVPDAGRDPAFLRATRDVNSEICVPLFRKGDVLGVLNVEGSRRKPLTEQDLDVLNTLSGPIAIAIENAHLHAEATALARIDGLTGLMNRRTFDETLESELARAARYDCPLTLIILDIDDFKSCNDHWGHPAGDALLRATARLIRRTTRSTDSAARYGGDEFAIILPNTSLTDGLEMGERLRKAATGLGIEGNDDGVPAGRYTFSLGVASFPNNGLTAEQLLIAADHAELRAKQRGKNRIFQAEVRA